MKKIGDKIKSFSREKTTLPTRPSVSADWLRYLGKVAILKKHRSEGFTYACTPNVNITDDELETCRAQQEKEGLRTPLFEPLTAEGFARWLARTHAERIRFGRQHAEQDGMVVMCGAGLSAGAKIPTFRGKGGIYERVKKNSNSRPQKPTQLRIS